MCQEEYSSKKHHAGVDTVVCTNEADLEERGAGGTLSHQKPRAVWITGGRENAFCFSSLADSRTRPTVTALGFGGGSFKKKSFYVRSQQAPFKDLIEN
ncbi:hypothetical protein EYF80_020827 [Liparis tanakae]|uniref:Uncharacterized protein n=1 Tax=Liparis tanakae TaxID=230148 RepID=A0A4Z2HSX8_9TELE|nr:hypothetical protein EYF80_020827 [Liparis tanakae]